MTSRDACLEPDEGVITTAIVRGLDYPHLPVKLAGTTLVLAPVCLAGCIDVIDLRAPAGDEDGRATGDTAGCLAGERIDPQRGECAPCTYTDPRTVCPCGFTSQPGDFPLCDEPDADFICTPSCSGDVSACTAYRINEGTVQVSDCELLRQCCAALANDASATPCCVEHHSLLCFRGTGPAQWPFTFQCVNNACCEAGCVDDGDCDTAYQTCNNNRCVPGCHPPSAYCFADGVDCECRALFP